MSFAGINARAGTALFLPHSHELWQKGQIHEHEFQGQGRIRTGNHPLLTLQSHLPGGMNLPQAELVSHLQPLSGFFLSHLQQCHPLISGLLEDKEIAPDHGHVLEKKADIQPAIQELPHQVQDGLAVLLNQSLHAVQHQLLTGEPEKGLHCLGCDLGLAQGYNLTQKRKTVPDTPCPFAGQDPHSIRIIAQALLIEDPGHVLLQGLLFHPLKHIVLAAADNSGRKLMGFSGSQDKAHMAGRLFQSLEQGVEGIAREHVGFINDDHFVPAVQWSITHIFGQFANMVHTSVRSAVDLGHIKAGALGNLTAELTYIAGFRSRSLTAVDSLGQYSGHSGLANSSGPAEHIGWSHLALGCGPGQDLSDCLLSHYLGKELGPIGCC